MAVQAQYPSNVLLFSRSGQETKNPLADDYSTQKQPGGGGGGFLDQNHMIFNNGVANNPRKRSRELTSGGTMITNPFVSMQSQLIDLAQLRIPPPNNAVSTGLRLAFGDQQQQSLSSQSSVLLPLLSKDLASQIKQQQDEIDQFLQSQEEQLRCTLAEKRRRHYSAILGAAEESASRRLREKEAEVEKAVRRNSELEARATQLMAEAHIWQARARAQETAAATLQAQLQQAMVCVGGMVPAADKDDERVDSSAGDADDAESVFVDPDRVVEFAGPSCKVCRKRVATVVILPCRHLCVCTECDAEADACPLCLSGRSSSLEVVLC